MRAILFRGKTDKGEWVFGDLLHPDLYGNGYSIEDFSKEKDNCCDVIPETVGQYTGLTDKNGKKIFEGDIVKGSWDTIFQVVYDDFYLGFMAKEKTGYQNCLDYYGLNKIEVIGNIHDNPELLKGGEG